MSCILRRERVKRAKKEASKLAAKQEKDAKAEESKKDQTNPSEESNPDVDKVAASATPPKRPDLKELSKELPSGWQVLGMFHLNCLMVSFLLLFQLSLTLLLIWI